MERVITLLKFSFLITFLSSISVIPFTQAADFSDTVPPRVTLEEVKGIRSDLNILLFKIEAEDNANAVSLQQCGAGYIPPNCSREGIFTFQSDSQNPPTNIAPACISRNLTYRYLTGVVLGSNSQNPSGRDSYKYASTFYVAVSKTPFEKIPEGCPQWRNDNLHKIVTGAPTSQRMTVIDEAGNSTEVPLAAALQSASTFPTSTQGMCFLVSNPQNLGSVLTNLSGSYEKFISSFASDSLYREYTRNTVVEKRDELLRNARSYGKFYSDSFSPTKLNELAPCNSLTFMRGSDVINLVTDTANLLAELSDKLTIAAAENRAKAEAEAKAKTKSKGSTITCVKGKSTLKVSGKKPKCPSGYKKK